MSDNQERPTVKSIIGQVYKASTTDYIVVRIRGVTPIEKLELGAYITITGMDFDYICKVVEISSREIVRGAADEKVFSAEMLDQNVQIRSSDLNLRTGRLTYDIKLEPLKALPVIKEDSKDSKAKEPQTIPPLLGMARMTRAVDLERLYDEEEKYYVTIGHLRGIADIEPVAAKIDLKKLQELHGAVFAKTGAGKTYLARIIAGHIVARKDGCVLVFDMHSEYGYGKGLKIPFPNSVLVFSVDPNSSAEKVDEHIEIPYEDIKVSDALLALDLTSTQVEALYQFQAKYENEWLNMLIDDKKEDQIILDTGGRTDSKSGKVKDGEIPRRTIKALRRKVRARITSLPCIVEQSTGNKSSLETMVNEILKANSLVVDFGRYSNDSIIYALITNIITRRIFQIYQDKFRKGTKDLPWLTILIEEAHKFLNKELHNSTFFGQFIREARKFQMSLLIVDQRPSKIYDDVLSQIGTLFLLKLTNEQDMKAITRQSEEDLSNYQTEIRRLNRQEALVSGQACDFTLSIRVLKHEYSTLLKLWKIESQRSIADTLPEGIEDLPEDGF